MLESGGGLGELQEDPSQVYQEDKEMNVDIAVVPPPYRFSSEFYPARVSCLLGRFAYNKWPTEKITSNLLTTMEIYTRHATLDDEKLYLNADGSFYPSTAYYRVVGRMLSRKGPAGVYDITNYQSWEKIKKVVEDAIEQRKEFPPERVRGKYI